MSHRYARLTVHGRRLLVQRVQAGRPVAHVAAEMGISRVTAHKWVRRWREEGEAGLHAYNYHRCHTALGGRPPISRVNNAAGQYS
ncbi:helix-turn-helix domain-containing protein [Streptomyces sp. McG5]|nr:helix-turn-helix domain-containing protein [Streptomyces sp. McG6]MBT2887285.1 helix-turn-helix domain-containing protein [Streptomyces sp. McG5]MBT2889217.1 helix-turn-helix domain-containing protein [Streptomyces sp. McG2]